MHSFPTKEIFDGIRELLDCITFFFHFYLHNHICMFNRKQQASADFFMLNTVADFLKWCLQLSINNIVAACRLQIWRKMWVTVSITCTYRSRLKLGWISLWLEKNHTSSCSEKYRGNGIKYCTVTLYWDSEMNFGTNLLREWSLDPLTCSSVCYYCPKSDPRSTELSFYNTVYKSDHYRLLAEALDQLS